MWLFHLLDIIDSYRKIITFTLNFYYLRKSIPVNYSVKFYIDFK